MPFFSPDLFFLRFFTLLGDGDGDFPLMMMMMITFFPRNFWFRGIDFPNSVCNFVSIKTIFFLSELRV